GQRCVWGGRACLWVSWLSESVPSMGIEGTAWGEFNSESQPRVAAACVVGGIACVVDCQHVAVREQCGVGQAQRKLGHLRPRILHLRLVAPRLCLELSLVHDDFRRRWPGLAAVTADAGFDRRLTF